MRTLVAVVLALAAFVATVRADVTTVTVGTGRQGKTASAELVRRGTLIFGSVGTNGEFELRAGHAVAGTKLPFVFGLDNTPNRLVPERYCLVTGVTVHGHGLEPPSLHLSTNIQLFANNRQDYTEQRLSPARFEFEPGFVWQAEQATLFRFQYRVTIFSTRMYARHWGAEYTQDWLTNGTVRVDEFRASQPKISQRRFPKLHMISHTAKAYGAWEVPYGFLRLSCPIDDLQGVIATAMSDPRGRWAPVEWQLEFVHRRYK